MRLTCLAAFALGVLGHSDAVPRASAQALAASAADRQLLVSVGLGTDAPALLEFFRQRAALPVDPGEVSLLVQQLADPSVEVRNRAAAELLRRGPAISHLLRPIANSLEDIETAERARTLLEHIHGPMAASLTMAATHLLAEARPAGAAAALLAFLPAAEDEQVIDAVGRALHAVAARDGATDPALLAALRDPLPIRRAHAIDCLIHLGGAKERAQVKPLLRDPVPAVRLRAALGLANARDAEAVGTLIALLGELPPAQARPVEELLAGLAGEWGLSLPSGEDEIARRVRRQVWEAWWQATDGPALLGELARRSLPEGDCERALRLVQQLGDDAAAVRDQARVELLRMGGVVAPLLRQAANEPRLKAAIAECLTQFEPDELPPLPAAAPRLLAFRRPPGALEALLSYVPFAAEGAMLDEVRSTITVLAVRDGMLEPMVLQALNDRLPKRRALAAEAICRTRLPDGIGAVRELLRDSDLVVRMRAGLALASARERQALPVLIALLPELPMEQAWQVEDFLQLVAGDQTPLVAVGPDGPSRAAARDAWTSWWRRHGETLDPVRLERFDATLGHTLIVEQYNPLRRGGRVFEIDGTGTIRWQFDGLLSPCDAQAGPGDRVLIAEQGLGRVSVRDTKGKGIWQKNVSNLIGAHFLRTGHVFIAMRTGLTEADATGKEVFTYNRSAGDIVAAQKLRTGEMIFVTYNLTCMRLGLDGKEQRSFQLPPFPFGYYNQSFEFLPGDRLLVAQHALNKVVEYDARGRVLWEANAPLPISASRLPSGRTLIACSGSGGKVIEVDRTGKTVWEYKDNVRPFRVRRR